MEPYLDADETAIWVGRPVPPPQTFRSFTGEFASFAASWVFVLALAAAAVDLGMGSLANSERVFGGVFLVLAALLIFVAAKVSLASLRDRKDRADETYALTNRRALLLRRVEMKPTLRSVPIHPELWLSYSPGVQGEIGFSRAIRADPDEEFNAFDDEMLVFRQLSDAEAVYRLVRSIQKATP